MGAEKGAPVQITGLGSIGFSDRYRLSQNMWVFHFLFLTSSLFYYSRDLIMKLNASMEQVDRKKNASVLIGFCPIAALSLKLWDAFITAGLVRNYAPLSLKKIFSER